MLQQFEGLKIFTLSISLMSVAKYLEDVDNTPIKVNQKNTFISMDIVATLDYFGGYIHQPPYSCIINRKICPVGLWMDSFGHGFIIIDEDGMLYIAGHDSIFVISDSIDDFWDNLVLMKEKFRMNEEKYKAVIDMTLYKE